MLGCWSFSSRVISLRLLMGIPVGERTQLRGVLPQVLPLPGLPGAHSAHRLSLCPSALSSEQQSHLSAYLGRDLKQQSNQSSREATTLSPSWSHQAHFTKERLGQPAPPPPAAAAYYLVGSASLIPRLGFRLELPSFAEIWAPAREHPGQEELLP